MSAVRHAKAITPSFVPYGVDLERGAPPRQRSARGSLGAKVALCALLSLGLIDVGVLDLHLAPKLARGAVLARAGHVAAAGAPARAETQAAKAPAREAIAPSPSQAERGAPDGRETAAPRTRVRAMVDIEFDLESVKTDNIEAIRGLHGVLDELAADPARRLVVRGHADRLGTPEYNERLSRRRALAMRDWLVVRGAPLERISVEAAGSGEPADVGDGPIAWAHNRRCELLWD